MAKNLKKFAQHTDYEAYTGTTYLRPNVSLCLDVKDVHYNPVPPLCLTFEAIEDGTFSFSMNAVQYSLDEGSTWTTLSAGASSPTIAAGRKISWKAELVPSSSSTYGIGTFSSTGRFNVIGNPLSLLYGENFKDVDNLSGKSYAFYSLFANCVKCIDASNMKLTALVVERYCYYGMFSGCTSLIAGPALDAATASTYYQGYHFDRMFDSCTSLETLPSLSSSATFSYMYTFYGCTSLVHASGQTIDPTLVQYMFAGCTSLQTGPVLNGTFQTGTAGHLSGGAGLYSGCSSLSQITFYGTRLGQGLDCVEDICTHVNTSGGWVKGVASTGTFIKKAGVTISYNGSSSCGVNNIPCNWTIVEQ